MLQLAVAGGEIRVVEVPDPVLRAGGILVRTSHSLISAGTESAGLGTGGRSENLAMKALRNPQLIRKVLARASTHGLKNTLDLVKTRIGSEMAAGYACSGIVMEVSPEVNGFRPGDRVACCGAGYANHAGMNFIPRNLAVRIPDNVSFPEAAFGTLGAIALQGIRRCAPQLGDRIAVLGLGLLGQLTIQLLHASGACVIGVDVRSERIERALQLGMDEGFNALERDYVSGVLERTEGLGADATIITAAGEDPALLNRSFDATRKKGRVVLVGDVPIRIQRDKIYKKELDFFISTSYGPGRYDPEYEERGVDYPFPYVRWTEGRNLEEVLRCIARGSLKVEPLIDAIFPIERAADAYALLASAERPIGILLDYHLEGPTPAPRRTYVPKRGKAEQRPDTLRLGIIGYGDYLRAVLLPAIRTHGGFSLHSVCARSGLTVRAATEKDGFSKGTTDYGNLLADPEVDAVIIATRHDQHFPIARAALEAGKPVFVEKPMTLTARDGRELADLVAQKEGLLTVGFNRRFSPHAVRLKKLLQPISGRKMLLYRINAGPLPAGHWLLDPLEGGGRLLGEGVHFFDLLAFLAGDDPVLIRASRPAGISRDEGSIAIEFADGSVGTVFYSGCGSPAAGKERIEVFAGGSSFVIDDFRSLSVYGCMAKGLKTRKIEKGQAQQLQNFYRAITGEEELGCTAEDGYRATWCAEQALISFALENG